MGNSNISITAEFVSLIKAKTDKNYNYFVSDKTRKLYNFISFIFSKVFIDSIFQNRLQLSDEFDDFLLYNDFETIAEFGCGFSLRGFEYSLKNSGKVYIDSDFKEVIETKKQILNKICEENKIDFPSNYILLPIDVLDDDIAKKTGGFIKGKSLFLAEGLTSYFDIDAYTDFIAKIKPYLNEPQNVFFSQENFLKKQPFAYKIIRKFVALLTKSRSYIKFRTKEDLIEFLKKQGFHNCQAYYKNDSLFYRIN